MLRNATYGHDETTDADIGRKPLANSRKLPENSKEAAHSASEAMPFGDSTSGVHVLVFSRVNHTRDDLPNVCASADEEEDDKEERVEVKESRLLYR